MRVRALETRGFRNLADGELAIGGGITVLHGPNGAGKTNLVEALYFGLTASSFRPGPDRDLIGFEQRAARVELELEEAGGRRRRLLAALDRGGERRHLVDGRVPAGGAARPLAAVFHPDRLALLKGPPAHRRAHLDRFLAALWPARADLRSRFGKTLAQRNSLASRVRRGEAPAVSLAVWDERLAAEAAPLSGARAEAAESLASSFARHAEALGLEQASVRYRPRADAAAEAIAARLGELRDSGELGRAYLGFGPQLDELVVSSGGRSLRRFGSQGQQRVALLALLFAERAALLGAGRPAPIMLLDDVMSELDPAHRELLVSVLGDGGQALLTATEPAQVPAPQAHRVAVASGSLRTLAAAA